LIHKAPQTVTAAIITINEFQRLAEMMVLSTLWNYSASKQVIVYLGPWMFVNTKVSVNTE